MPRWLVSDDTLRRLQREREAEQQRGAFRAEQDRAEYAEKWAELVAEGGEEFVVELEQRLFRDGQPFADTVVAR